MWTPARTVTDQLHSVGTASTQRRAEALAHIASCTAICTTIFVLGWGASETNPVSRWLMNTIGTYTFALATPVLVSLMYRLLNVFGPGDWLYWYPTTVLTLDAVGNLYGLTMVGLPEQFAYAEWIAVSLGMWVLAWALYNRIGLKLLPNGYRSTA